MKTDLFQSCGQFWVFQICWHIEGSTLMASFFRILNSSAGFLSPPLALLVVMLSKAYLTSHFRMSGSRWVTTLLSLGTLINGTRDLRWEGREQQGQFWEDHHLSGLPVSYLTHPRNTGLIPLWPVLLFSYLLCSFPRGSFLNQELIMLLSLFKCLKWLTGSAGSGS